ncbi:putative ABC ATPase, partial [Helicosporidium sp. ATCC 50920]
MSGRGGGRGRGAYFKAKYGGGRSRTDHAPYDASSSAAWAGDRPAPSPSSPSSWAFAPPRGDAAALRRTLQSLEGESFGRYKQLTGSWSLALPSGGAALLSIDHVQGDAYASPSRVRVFVPPPLARLPAWALACEARQTACADFLARSLAAAAGCRAGSYWQGLPSAQSQGSWGSEKGGQLFVDAPGQAVLRRTTVQLRSCAANQGGFGPSGGGAPSAPESTGVEARLSVALPGRGRSILGHQAAAILTQQLPEAVEAALLSSSLGLDDLRRHCESVEDSRALRDALESRGLAAFVGDGSLLPRAGGADDRPMSLSSSPELWNGPPELSVELLTPNGGMVRGTGFPRGLTVIVGGGFHGKSTLLAALQRGVYDHAPGDGRERVVALCDAVKVRAEDGRHVSSVDVSPLISTLPRGGGTRAFSSADASGSTSQAASIAEAVEAGSRLLLVDEDTSATNLMIRDARMRELVAAERE